MTEPSIRVRFAPSPTGFLHVGGARTALFNWLFARRHAGTFVLRIEDTDLARSSEEMVRAILDGMTWLGLDWDEGPFFQSASRGEHVAKALRLLSGGRAYRCWCDPADLDARRKAAEAAGGSWKYDRTCLGRSAAEVERLAASGAPSCVRLHVPAGTAAWDDLVHGPVSFENAEIEDLVLLRSDGTPTYNLACVSDDVDMRITHVIRGDDHISNTPKQILIYRALGLEAPRFGHLPLILGEDKKRLSKRHGAVGVMEYRRTGYLPEALFNFLALLGWSPGGDRELMSREEMISLFSFEGVNPRSAVFDHAKLDWMNGQYLARTSAGALAAEVKLHLVEAGLWREDLEEARRAWLLRLVETLRSRSRTIADLARDARPFLTDLYDFEPEAVTKHLSGADAAARLTALAGALEKAPAWEEGPLEDALRGLAGTSGVAAGKLIHPARAALTGRTASPGIFEVMVLLGRESTLGRLRRGAAIASGAFVPPPPGP